MEGFDRKSSQGCAGRIFCLVISVSRSETAEQNMRNTEKYLRCSGDCGILSIKKDICANRCPTGATDRRSAQNKLAFRKAAQLWTGAAFFAPFFLFRKIFPAYIRPVLIYCEESRRMSAWENGTRNGLTEDGRNRRAGESAL